MLSKSRPNRAHRVALYPFIYCNAGKENQFHFDHRRLVMKRPLHIEGYSNGVGLADALCL